MESADSGHSEHISGVQRSFEACRGAGGVGVLRQNRWGRAMGVDREGLTLDNVQLTTNQIKASLNNRCYPGAIVICHWCGDVIHIR